VFKNVGGNNPRVTFELNHVERCGVKVLNNTEPGVIDIYIQNTRCVLAHPFITINWSVFLLYVLIEFLIIIF
jgi:hypothetical protein